MIIQANAINIPLTDNSVHCVVTSPPYYGLRNYNVDGQIGLEQSVEEYVDKMVLVFREVRRVLRQDGVCFLNLGDSYFGSGSPGGDFKNGKGGDNYLRPYNRKGCSLKPKDLCGIPWRVAFALQADGWWLRQDIIWVKKNPMPESVRDRFTKSHEYIFLLTKSARYFWDAESVKELAKDYAPRNRSGDKINGATGLRPHAGFYSEKYSKTGRNRRNVITISSQPYKGAHFATFPEKLIEPLMLAGTSAKGCCSACGAPLVRVVEKNNPPNDGKTETKYETGSAASRLSMKRQAARERGYEFFDHTKTTGWKPNCKCNAGKPIPCIVLDPFSGSGTTGVVAERYGRDYIGLELNLEYIQMSLKRMARNQMRLVLS